MEEKLENIEKIEANRQHPHTWSVQVLNFSNLRLIFDGSHSLEITQLMMPRLQSLKKAAAPWLSFKRIVRSATTSYNCTGTLSFQYHLFSQLNEKLVASYHLVCPLVYSTWTWTRDVHSTLCNINLFNVTSSLISRNLRERMFSVQISLVIVIIIIIAIVARLTLWYFIVSPATLILNYHASMFTLQNSLISRAFWLSQAWQYGV
jgi:hypothetical protein